MKTFALAMKVTSPGENTAKCHNTGTLLLCQDGICHCKNHATWKWVDYAIGKRFAKNKQCEEGVYIK
jgi:hypothetical protein